ncbi:MAG: type II toxin-antitoxin system Phd/YefM family antitoxin [Caldilineaceae bacterium]|nr:type II toxin-antitoxin system Phd/YefM family antitoxin [Caldilineaceae bacterium]MCB0123536.1 type II toxin-antitoxin system Phd/YefM family antitoxin [Caldilineaceae bacterium]
MERVPQIVPISEMKLNQPEVMEKLEAGPVILANRSRAAAVLVSVEQWDRMVTYIEDLEDALDVAKLKLADARGEVEWMSQQEISDWLAEDEQVPA